MSVSAGAAVRIGVTLVDMVPTIFDEGEKRA